VFHLFYSYPADRFFLPILVGVAVIAGISAIEPVFLEQRVARGSKRRIVPLSRDIEYGRAVYPSAPGVRPRYIIQFMATEQMEVLVAEALRG